MMNKLFSVNGFQKILLSLFICVTLCMPACHYHKSKKKHKETSVITIASKATTKTLYFSGTVKPLARIPVICPLEGVVSDMLFKYGQQIEKGKSLFKIHSGKQQSDFQSALTEFVKAKQDLNSGETKLKDTKKLYKQGLVSRNEYEQDRTTYYLNRLSFIQAKTVLDEALKFHHIKDISKLSLSDINDITKAFELGKKTEITIKAHRPGIALFPQGGGESDDKIKMGSQVKQGQVLLDIGDMKGIEIEIKVNEININQIQAGQKAAISSVAFPNVTLHGFIKSIDAQASSAGGSPVFAVSIIIPTLTNEQKNVIHVGMSSKIRIKLESKAHITIPIKAITRKNGQTFVTAINPSTKKMNKVEVITGETMLDSVIITSGLKNGDQIVAPN